ncbi:MAG TPA: diphosphomevalonate decarboxylase [Anaerolineaceae bacterium]|nr:diphosphomevalonate decarboxylase [Anaerolineaceae bacterium]
MQSASAIAHPNIAFIKYWGNRDDNLRLPENGSISMNLDGLSTRTQVTFSAGLPSDRFTLNGVSVTGPGLERVSRFLDLFRRLSGVQLPAEVQSTNDFPTGAGIASSAAAFSALSQAAAAALDLSLTDQQLSRLARRGSGSACRSVPGGFVEWLPGGSDEDSFAVSIAPPDHWDLTDCIAIVSNRHKPVGSTAGHALAKTSPLQAARVADTPRRLEICRSAILQRDFDALSSVVELDSNLMHAVMMSSTPPLFYWEPASLNVMKSVPFWRKHGVPACYTLDAGPNVHVICPSAAAGTVCQRLEQIPGVMRVLKAGVGGPARRLDPSLV